MILQDMTWSALLFLVVAVNALADEPAKSTLHRVTFTDVTSVTRTVEARVLLEAQDGGLLLEARDGRLWNVTPKQVPKTEFTDEPFSPLDADALGQQLQRELLELGVKTPTRIITTKHYVICSTAGRKYAEWVGALFERLHDSFQSFWKKEGLELREPEFPLPAIVLKDQAEFAELATKHDGPEAARSEGYFSIPTNRIVMFDLTAGPNSTPAKTPLDIQRKIAASPFNVATIIHEATHQIAFNSGMHTRYADNPMWLTEGMAMFFEVPDLDSRTGWKTIGRVNSLRLQHFRESLRQMRPADSLAMLIRADDRFLNAEQSRAAYAESWALTYFLIKTRRDDYIAYLKKIDRKPRLVADTPDDRLRDFAEIFGNDFEMLDRELRAWLPRPTK
jgi:uncharacterized protein DUF1570